MANASSEHVETRRGNIIGNRQNEPFWKFCIYFKNCFELEKVLVKKICCPGFRFLTVISSPEQSQRLLYKNRCKSFIN